MSNTQDDGYVSPDDLKKILHEYISEEEIKTLKKLEQKAIEAEQKIKEYVLAKTDPSEEKVDLEDNKKLPYYVDIVISLEIKKSDNKTTVPYTVAQESRKYEIDFVSDDYKVITDNLYEELQEIITKRCKKLPSIQE